MLQLPIGSLLSGVGFISATNQQYIHLVKRDTTPVFSDFDHEQFELHLIQFIADCKLAHLSVSAKLADDLLFSWRKAVPCPNGRQFVGQRISRTQSRMQSLMHGFQAEGRTKVAMLLPPENAEMFEQTEPPLGAEVATKFPGLAYDIDEALKCMALGRSTACAFHLIRCLEGGISAISRCLGIPDATKGADRNWGTLLRNIEAAYKAKWPTAADRFNGPGQFFENLHGRLAAMRNPYRNATMHLEKTYTEDEARSLLAIVKSLMTDIAAEMDENGAPKA